MKATISCRRWQSVPNNIQKVKSDGKKTPIELFARGVQSYKDGKPDQIHSISALYNSGKVLKAFNQFGQVGSAANGWQYTQILNRVNNKQQTNTLAQNVHFNSLPQLLDTLLQTKGYQASDLLYNRVQDANNKKGQPLEGKGGVHNGMLTINVAAEITLTTPDGTNIPIYINSLTLVKATKIESCALPNNYFTEQQTKQLDKIANINTDVIAKQKVLQKSYSIVTRTSYKKIPKKVRYCCAYQYRYENSCIKQVTQLINNQLIEHGWVLMP